MTIKQLIDQAKGILLENNLDSDLAIKLYTSLFKVCDWEIIIKSDSIVTEDNILIYENSIKRLLGGVPIQYIIGDVDFYGYTFLVNKNVLIPRFETEELVEHTIYYIKKHFTYNPTIVDIGTGSGVIGITIKKELPDSAVFLTDISKDALDVAEQNAQRLCVEVTTLQGNMLEPLFESKIDVLISNPPYIKETEIVEEIVKNNEPTIALYGGNDGLKYYKEILANASNYLKTRSLLAFEISESIKDEVVDLAYYYFADAEIIVKKDLQQRDRMLFILNNLD
jgi:release factor glutamine methyltransferase